MVHIQPHHSQFNRLYNFPPHLIIGESLMETSSSASPDCSAATPPRSSEDGCRGSTSCNSHSDSSVSGTNGEENPPSNSCNAEHPSDGNVGEGTTTTCITVVCNGRIIKQEEDEDDGVEEDEEDEIPERSSQASASSASDGGFISSPGLSRGR